MSNWENRPVEIAHLLNPAFCAVLLHDSTRAHVEIIDLGISYPLMFVILPFVLHKVTRDEFPKDAEATLQEWYWSHPDIHLSFPERTRQLVHYTKEALIFGFQQGVFSLEEDNVDGNILPTRKTLNPLSTWPRNSDAYDCRQKAKYLGRWLAQTGDTSTIYRVLGIRP